MAWYVMLSNMGTILFARLIYVCSSYTTRSSSRKAAGLMVTFGSLSETSTEIRKYSKKLYQELEAETGQSTGFKPVGFIELATEPDR
jgi:glycine/D-amino acid oxidase-like deaminating enzyme